MKATLTLDFSDRLRPEETRELIGEAMRRQVPLEDVLTEAVREWRAARAQRVMRPELPVGAAMAG